MSRKQGLPATGERSIMVSAPKERSGDAERVRPRCVAEELVVISAKAAGFLAIVGMTAVTTP